MPAFPAAAGGLWLAYLKPRPYQTAAPADLERAHLSGRWHLTFTVGRSENVDVEPGRAFAGRWRFDPQCPSGPCPVGVADLMENSTLGTLTPVGASYTLAAQTPGVCEFEDGTSVPGGYTDNVEMTLTPTKAERMGEAFIVTAFRGSEVVRSDPTPDGAASGCGPAMLSTTFTAIPVKDPFVACERFDDLLVRFSELCFLLAR